MGYSLMFVCTTTVQFMLLCYRVRGVKVVMKFQFVYYKYILNKLLSIGLTIYP
jgi:hypothetical protein